jgi:hypothetical protein
MASVRSNIPSAPGQFVTTGVTASAGEINYTDITTVGTVQATKAVVVDGSKDVSGFNDVGIGGALTVTGAATVGGVIGAGEDASAGEINVYPATTSKGFVSITATDNAGDTETAIVAGAQAGARTYTIPDALASTDFMLGKQNAVARTATSDGLTTGIIADAGRYQAIAVTSASANNIIVLPTPTPGTVIDLFVGSNGYELRSSAPATVLIGGGAGGAAVESAIPADSWAHLVCVDATHWVGYTITGATLAAVEAAG